MKTQRERDEAKRAEKLEAMAEQIADGSLTVRKMTEEERKRHARPEGAAPPPRRKRPSR